MLAKNGTNETIRAFALPRREVGALVSASAEEFRSRADECYRLSVQLRDPEHKSFALFLATAWLALAQQAEQRHTAPNAMNSTIPTPPADSQPKDQISPPEEDQQGGQTVA
jgi:hypothetical protein